MRGIVTDSQRAAEKYVMGPCVHRRGVHGVRKICAPRPACCNFNLTTIAAMMVEPRGVEPLTS